MPGNISKMREEAPCAKLKPRGRPKVKPDCVQRCEILKAARELFLSCGYGKTTTGDIAARCGISKRTLYRLYPSKAEIFAGIITFDRTRLFRLLDSDSHLPAAIALERMFVVDLDPEEEIEREAVMRIVVTESDSCPELREIVRRYGAEIAMAELASWLSERHNAGEIEIDDPDAYAQILMDMVFGTLVKNLPDHPSIPRGHARTSHIRRCIALFLNGVATERNG